jgi:hypothetical protein
MVEIRIERGDKNRASILYLFLGALGLGLRRGYEAIREALSDLGEAFHQAGIKSLNIGLYPPAKQVSNCRAVATISPEH